jgi:hypothetical protein
LFCSNAKKLSVAALVSAATARPELHPEVGGVAHDPVGADVLDRAQIQLSFFGAVFGDVDRLAHERVSLFPAGSPGTDAICGWSSE